MATPGRLLDHVQQKTVALGQVEILVLDEADRMLDMGFMPRHPAHHGALDWSQTALLFSATFSPEIRKLASDFLKNPETIEVARQNSTESVKQELHPVETFKKKALLAHLIRTHAMSQVIVFCRTKQGADQLARDLKRERFNVEAIHGDRTQIARLETMAAFKEGKLPVLVATDVAARGLDISDLPFVVNYDLPHNAKTTCTHRAHRARRCNGCGDLFRDAGRRQVLRRHQEADQEGSAAGSGARFLSGVRTIAAAGSPCQIGFAGPDGRG